MRSRKTLSLSFTKQKNGVEELREGEEEAAAGLADQQAESEAAAGSQPPLLQRLVFG